MCGLVGIAGDLDSKHRDAFKQLLIVDQLRGTHGTGVASVGYTGDVDWVKKGDNAHGLIDLKAFDRVVTTTKRVIIGHNRYATLGAHNSDNAHPFDFKHVVGAHNGTLPISVRRALSYYTKYDTDSEALYAEFDKNMAAGMPWQQALGSVIGTLDDGAWALTMYLKEPKKFAMLRNGERPLFYCTVDEGQCLVWASEAWMLYSILSRTGCKIDNDNKVYALPEDVLYAWDLPTGSRKDTIKEPERIQMKGAPKKVWDYTQNFQNGVYRGTTSTRNQHTTSTKKGPTFPNQNKRGHFKPPYKFVHGGIMTKPEFETQIRLGETCCYCNNNTPTWGQEVMFLRPTPIGSPQYLCETCLKDDEILDIAKAMR